jgi:hypothetical protein
MPAVSTITEVSEDENEAAPRPTTPKAQSKSPARRRAKLTASVKKAGRIVKAMTTLSPTPSPSKVADLVRDKLGKSPLQSPIQTAKATQPKTPTPTNTFKVPSSPISTTSCLSVDPNAKVVTFKCPSSTLSSTHSDAKNLAESSDGEPMIEFNGVDASFTYPEKSARLFIPAAPALVPTPQEVARRICLKSSRLLLPPPASSFTFRRSSIGTDDTSVSFMSEAGRRSMSGTSFLSHVDELSQVASIHQKTPNVGQQIGSEESTQFYSGIGTQVAQSAAAQQDTSTRIDVRDNLDIFDSACSSTFDAPHVDMLASLAKLASTNPMENSRCICTMEGGRLVARFKLPAQYHSLFPLVQEMSPGSPIASPFSSVQPSSDSQIERNEQLIAPGAASDQTSRTNSSMDDDSTDDGSTDDDIENGEQPKTPSAAEDNFSSAGSSTDRQTESDDKPSFPGAADDKHMAWQGSHVSPVLVNPSEQSSASSFNRADVQSPSGESVGQLPVMETFTVADPASPIDNNPDSPKENEDEHSPPNATDDDSMTWESGHILPTPGYSFEPPDGFFDDTSMQLPDGLFAYTGWGPSISNVSHVNTLTKSHIIVEERYAESSVPMEFSAENQPTPAERDIVSSVPANPYQQSPTTFFDHAGTQSIAGEPFDGSHPMEVSDADNPESPYEQITYYDAHHPSTPQPSFAAQAHNLSTLAQPPTRRWPDQEPSGPDQYLYGVQFGPTREQEPGLYQAIPFGPDGIDLHPYSPRENQRRLSRQWDKAQREPSEESIPPGEDSFDLFGPPSYSHATLASPSRFTSDPAHDDVSGETPDQGVAENMEVEGPHSSAESGGSAGSGDSDDERNSENDNSKIFGANGTAPPLPAEVIMVGPRARSSSPEGSEISVGSHETEIASSDEEMGALLLGLSVLQQTPTNAGSSVANHEDAERDHLRQFLSKHKSKAANPAEPASGREPLGALDVNIISPSKRKLEEEEMAANTKRRRWSETEEQLESQLPANTVRRSSRVQLRTGAPSALTAARSSIPVRLPGSATGFNDNTEGLMANRAMRKGEKDLARQTAENTRKNKGSAVFPATVLVRMGEAPVLSLAAPTTVAKARTRPTKAKSVQWDETLVRYQGAASSDSAHPSLTPLPAPAAPPTEEEEEELGGLSGEPTPPISRRLRSSKLPERAAVPGPLESKKNIGEAEEKKKKKVGARRTGIPSLGTPAPSKGAKKSAK